MKKNILILILLILTGFTNNAQTDLNELLWNKNDSGFKIEVETKTELKWEINTKLCLYRNDILILRDSIIVNRFELKFDDLNSDGHDDLLVYQGAGMRPNERYNLYLYQTKTNDYKKVIGFNNYPNVTKTDDTKILSAMFLAGEVSYVFFVIKDDAELIDLDLKVTDKNLDGEEFDKAFIKAQRYVAQHRI